MITRLTKPVERVVEIGGEDVIVLLTEEGIVFRRPRKRTGLLVPYNLTGLEDYAGTAPLNEYRIAPMDWVVRVRVSGKRIMARRRQDSKTNETRLTALLRTEEGGKDVA